MISILPLVFLKSCGDGTIRIFNVFTGKQSYILNQDMEDAMPTQMIRWRPLAAPGVTKNVILATNCNGTIQHWHTTSGRLLNQIQEMNGNIPVKTICCDYNLNGTDFVTGDSDGIVRVYDEQTRQLKVVYEGGGTGAAGHKMKVNCVKWVDENLIVSGGWDKTIKVWDIREPAPIRSIFGPYVAADSLDV